jgi:hypothetical protein
LRQAAHILNRQELFELVRRIILDQIAGVGERDYGVGNVLTEDDQGELGIPQQTGEHGGRGLVNERVLQVGEQPAQNLSVLQQVA